MPFTPGSRLGVYEISAPLGEGGMGQVFRATDTTLGREVAIKILPDAFASDPERMARFEREAKTLASLNHSNIAAIYGFEKSPSTSSGQAAVHALVMELVEGEDLSQRISRGAIPIDEALAMAKQIADALEAAHEQAIIHRDLKPANVKVRPDGTVKVLDFGLAKAMDQGSGNRDQGSGSLANSPTMTSPAMTQAGMILGTAAYMAPEQAKGKAVDRRADIWAFGVVLHEMLTGRHLFTADTIAETLAHVITRVADLNTLPATTPRRVRDLIARCLEKDPRKRLRDIGEARLILEDPTVLNPDVAPSSAATVAAAPFWRRALPWAIAGAAVLVAGVPLTLWAPWRAAPVPAPRKLLVSIGADVSIDIGSGASAILSPDGTTLVFAARPGDRSLRQLFVRKLDELQATALAGTESFESPTPFFSPDGQWIGFFADGKLKKVSVTGGAPVTLADAPNSRGGTWADDDTIIFTPRNSGRVGETGQAPVVLRRVAASGGTPSAIGTITPGALTQRWPQALPGGKAVLYTEHVGGTEFETANLVVAPLTSGAPTIVVRGGYYGRYVPSGHLLYMHEGTLFAVPFDLDGLETRGQAVPALEGIASNPDANGSAQLSFASDGTLVYVPGTASNELFPFDWMTRDGKTSPLRATKARWADPQFSPDGQKVAMAISDGNQYDIWVYEWARDTLTQLTFDRADDRHPVWTPDGKQIAFDSDRAKPGVRNLYWVNADGTGEPTRLTDSPAIAHARSWHPSGRFLAFSSGDVMVMPMEGDASRGWAPGTPTAFVARIGALWHPMFSPDGRFVAYASSEAAGGVARLDRLDIYVRSFPGPGGKWRISTDGGTWPTWSATSRELLFVRDSTRTIMAAAYTVVGDSFKADTPQPWAPTGYQSLGSPVVSGPYALHPDGKRVALAAAQDSVAEVHDQVVFISNFFDYLKRIAPVKP